MKASELRRRLERAYGNPPPETHLAFVTAACSRKEETVVKRKLRLTPVLAVLLVLLLATVAYAVTRFSVTDYATGGKPSEEFLSHVVTLDQLYENDVMTLSVNDAIFDGRTVTMAMDLTAKDPDTHLFLYPVLTGTVDGETYRADVESYGAGDFMSGFVYPAMPGHDSAAQGYGYGFDAVLLDDEAEFVQPDGPVDWTLTIQVLKPNYTVEYYDDEFTGEETEEAYRQKMQAYTDAYYEGRILVTNDGSLAEYASQLPLPEGMTEEEWWQKSSVDHLLLSGAYSLMDTVVVEFTTEIPDSASYGVGVGQRVDFDEYSVMVDALNVTFQTIDVDVRYEFAQEMTEEEMYKAAVPHYWLIYADESETPMPFSASSFGVDWDENGKPYLHVSIQVKVEEAAPQQQIRLEEAVDYDKSFADAAGEGNPMGREPVEIIIDLTK